MMLIRLLKDVNSWSDFKNVLESKSKLEKGKAFEELTKYYLQYNPIYKSRLKNVWLHSEVTPSLLKKLNIPSNDQGIDIVAETFEGKFWAIQCKYLQDEDQRLSHRAISTFVSLSTGIAENITYCLVCTTVDDYAKIYQGKANIGFCNSDEWRKLDQVFFDWLRNKLVGKEKKLIPYSPKPHQTKALQEARQYFIKENNTRGKLVFPCGAGKSLTGYWITRELKAKSVIVAVPSLSLVKQTLEVYLRESVANNEKVEWLCVCSDEGIGKNDDIVIHTNEIGVPCVTSKTIISDWLIKNKQKKTIIFTTYQSGKTVAEACKIAKHSFSLGIMDEAHKTVGEQGKLFSHLLFEKNIKIEQRIFMTATERRYAGSSDTILSMDDASVYGETFAQMSFKEAIEIGILSDYKIVTLFISNEEVRKLIEQNAFVKPTGKDWDRETEARTLAALIALRKAMTKFPINHAVTFHSSIKKAVAFEQSQSHFTTAYPKFSKVKSYHVSGTIPTAVRGKIVDEFAASKKGVITNAKCLTEGIDVPNIDCVLFADPRKSTVDIVQAVGRALRTKEGKKFGYVILPVFTKSNKTEEIIESAEFKEILNTIRALASNDERIIEYFRDVSKGVKKNKTTDKLIQFDIDEEIANHININQLTGALQLKTWNKLAKLSWMPFEHARSYVQALKLSSQKQWFDFISTGIKPFDIPSAPHYIYKNQGWESWGDWLGTGRIADQLKEFMKFTDARTYIRGLNFKNNKDYIKNYRSGIIPRNIPATPENVYKNDGWISWGDWLGTYSISNSKKKYSTFKNARLFVHKLKFKNTSDWKKYIKTSNIPDYIPAAPNVVYLKNGWKSWGDWLGNERISTNLREYLDFQSAREIIQSLSIKSVKFWKEYVKSGGKPLNIPNLPDKVYKGKGWISWGDWLGTNQVATFQKEYRSFDQARLFAQSLKIQTIDQWRKFCNSNDFTNDIPKAPDHVYKNKGWVNYNDWLGTKQYQSFENGRKFAKSLNISNANEWNQLHKNGKIPADIPLSPNSVYRKSGWVSWGDWLGSEYVANQQRIYKKHDVAKSFIQKLGLKSVAEWKDYCKSGEKPLDIPNNPENVYNNSGWKGYGDWLGTGTIAPHKMSFKPFPEARKFAHSLNLKSSTEWSKYSKSLKRPNDIPRNPNRIYKDKGWKGYGDWLGTGIVSNQNKIFLTYGEAKKYVHKLQLRSQKEWNEYCKKNERPSNIPRSPSGVYKNKGWINWQDFLGKK
jgi:superfamily II DNA or RNA helicase